MTASELVKLLAQRLGISQVQARRLLDGYVAALTGQLAQQNAVVLRNFGSFTFKHVPEKRAYIPSRNTLCIVPAHQKLHFKPSEKLRQAVNRLESDGENP